MNSRERVRLAFSHTQPDRPPCDYVATPEIQRALSSHFRVQGEEAVREALGADIHYVNPPYVGPALPRYEDGSEVNIWGIRKRPMPNEYGDYAEPVGLPYGDWATVEQAAAFPWPNPDWYDYAAMPALCARFPDRGLATGGYFVQDFINGVAFGRGVEQVLLDIAREDPVYLFIVERRHRFYLEVIERTLEASRGRIDFVLCGDDFGSQRGLLISPSSFERLFAARKKELFDLAHSYGAFVSHHCCGSSVALWPRFIELGMDAVQTIQPQAAGMDPYALKRAYGERITLHGAVDVQGWLQRATPAEVRTEVLRLREEVGAGGGFILGPCHNIQPDTPLANVLALYAAAAGKATT